VLLLVATKVAQGTRGVTATTMTTMVTTGITCSNTAAVVTGYVIRAATCAEFDANHPGRWSEKGKQELEHQVNIV
jgi:hypothetical protein